MSNLVNDRVLNAVRAAAEETNTVDGLKAILLVLEKLSGATGLITDNGRHGEVVLFVERKMNLLRVGSVLNE